MEGLKDVTLDAVYNEHIAYMCMCAVYSHHATGDLMLIYVAVDQKDRLVERTYMQPIMPIVIATIHWYVHCTI